MQSRILVIDVEIRLFDTQSLKEKRKYVKGITDRLRSRMNVSVAEVAFQDKWQKIGLTIAYVAQNDSTAVKVQQTIENEIVGAIFAVGEIIDFHAEIL